MNNIIVLLCSLVQPRLRVLLVVYLLGYVSFYSTRTTITHESSGYLAYGRRWEPKWLEMDLYSCTF
jgi:hypothetical protein